MWMVESENLKKEHSKSATIKRKRVATVGHVTKAIIMDGAKGSVAVQSAKV